ncbi:hypothetical protein INT47_013051 [Mucor saturninus]|uniref:Uncharacterized protein n=1 Tax=Mucor saturninus TaxID=64648 RepID=A0A8H7UQD2_9FUNG|nr:hypothetical protein INT47_013051 [Mucor saturninus]
MNDSYHNYSEHRDNFAYDNSYYSDNNYYHDQQWYPQQHQYESERFIPSDTHQSNDNKPLKNKDQSSVSRYFKESLKLYSVLPSSASFIKPLTINSDIIKKDADFIVNANMKTNKLPLYQIFVNGHPCTVLIDSGASANYIHPNLVPFVSRIKPAIQGQSVETANGQQIPINKVATFSVALGEYTDRIEAYVFDTKFDLILGRSWLSQVQPMPNWRSGSWRIKVRNNPDKVTHIYPLQLNSISQSTGVNDTPKPTNSEQSKDTSLTFLISAKQLDALVKKNKVEECYLIDISAVDFSPNNLLVMVQLFDLHTQYHQQRIGQMSTRLEQCSWFFEIEN